MKILFLNMLPDSHIYGHKDLDIKIIKALSSFSELYTITSRNWFEPYELKGVHIIEKSYSQKEGQLPYYFICVNKIYESYRMYKSNNIDYIVFASFDEYCLFLIKILPQKIQNKIFIIYHNNIDSIDMLKRKNFLFQRWCKKINHIVFEEFQREYMIKKYKIDSKQIGVLPHPMREKLPQREKEFDLVAISNSNDESWICFLIENERRNEYIKKRGLQVVFRSRQETFDNGYLHVIKGYLEKDRYNYYVSGAKVLFVPYPPTFRYRVSGVMIDAFSNGIRIIGTNIPIFKIYEKKYPQICKTIDSVQELMSEFDGVFEYGDAEDFRLFEKEHSMTAVIEALKTILKRQ